MYRKILLSAFVSASLAWGGGDLSSENGEDGNLSESHWSDWSLLNEAKDEGELQQRVFYTNVAATGLVVAWGVAFWDYFKANPQMHNEGWFGKDTKYGGADKLGHLYSTYLWSLGFASLYEYWGMDEERSRIYGPFSAWMVQGLMEIGDSFSDSQGFSYEDMTMNTVGAIFYYLREKYPAIKKRVDLRLEYLPDFSNGGDLFTQYNSMKYVLAFKASGFDSLNKGLLKYTELQVGYYTRGYQAHDKYSQKERVLYLGVGLNLSQILHDAGWKKTAKIFNYYQAPYTYVPFGHDFDTGGYVKPYSRPYHGYKF